MTPRMEEDMARARRWARIVWVVVGGLVAVHVILLLA